MRKNIFNQTGKFRPYTLVMIFFVLQCLTLNYGTRINHIDYIQNYKFNGTEPISTYLDRKLIAIKEYPSIENLQKWMIRFKLYSVEADEPIVFMALSKIKPGQVQFDPGLYQYGGAFLYPLGAFLYGYAKIFEPGSLNLTFLLDHPDTVDRLYVAGRFFVLFCFTLSAIFLMLAITPRASNAEVFFLTALYLFCPASIMFSQIMKPHWYALLWITISLWVTVSIFQKSTATFWDIIALSVSLGFAVGSVMLLGIYALLIWIVLLMAYQSGKITWKQLATIPIMAVLIFFLFNPFIVLNWKSFLLEAGTSAGWFSSSHHISDFYYFLKNSFFLEFGAVFGLFGLLLAFWYLLHGPSFRSRLWGIGIVGILIFISFLTASIKTWHTNVRYISYLLPGFILLISITRIPKKKWLLFFLLLLTLFQSLPLKIAYFDENNPIYSTRLSAAAWINQSINKNTSLCVATQNLTPFDTPPFDFKNYLINSESCSYLIRVEREPDYSALPDGFRLLKRFQPRLTWQIFPFVFSHINPQISIYGKK